MESVGDQESHPNVMKDPQDKYLGDLLFPSAADGESLFEMSHIYFI